MKPFTLEPLYRIAGIGSASGLFLNEGTLYVVSDNAAYLYEFDCKSQILRKTVLFDSDVSENIPKNRKPDLEALAEKDGKLYLFGSGSTAKRNSVFEVDLKTKQVLKRDLSALYDRMRKTSRISTDNFNLEGAFFTSDALFLFQRGNGDSADNGIFRIAGSPEAPGAIDYFAINLPKIANVATGFTDAAIVENGIWFLASAEDTKSTYEDGGILGSLIGKIDLNTMEIDFTVQISDTHKFEGLTPHSNSQTQISFLLCEDGDTDSLESTIFKLTLNTHQK